MTLDLMVGDHGSNQRSAMPPHRIVRFEAIGPQSVIFNLRDRFRLEGMEHDAQLDFDEPGTYLIVLESDNGARSDLAAEAFNDYIRAEGLTPALEHRSKGGRMAEPGSERYSRHAKTLVHVGLADAGRSAHATQPVGLLLEIIPERSPYSMQRSESLPVRVMYEDRALPGALVKLIDLTRGGRVVETRVTGETGRAELTQPARGTWLLSVVWTKVPGDSEEVEFETAFSTLSFGFDR